MAIEIKMPSVGTTTDEVRIVRWKFEEGQFVKKGDVLCEVETDKVIVEVESYAEGMLLKIYYEADSVITTGTVLAIIGNPEEDIKIISQGYKDDKRPDIIKENKNQADEIYKKNISNYVKSDFIKDYPVKKDFVKDNFAETAPAVNPAVKNIIGKNDAENFRSEDKINHENNLSLNKINKNKINKIDKVENEHEKLLQMYRKMFQIRTFEEKLKYLFLEGKMPGTIHQYIGMEACAVGVCLALEKDDVIASTHRPVGHALAKGLSADELMAELFGKVTGCCKGKGGAMHLGDLAKGMIPAIAVVGGNIPIITGVALSFKIRNEKRVAVSFFGDGASNEGAFHEALNMAAVYNLPAVFVCENNGYSASTSIKNTLKIENIADRASAYGMEGLVADGMNVLDVYEKAKTAVDNARNRKGPALLELKTFRFCGHSRRDPNTYMTEEEKKYWKEKDPIINFEDYLINEANISVKEIDNIKSEVELEIENSVEFAEKSLYPDPVEIYTDLYVNLKVPE